MRMIHKHLILVAQSNQLCDINEFNNGSTTNCKNETNLETISNRSLTTLEETDQSITVETNVTEPSINETEHTITEQQAETEPTTTAKPVLTTIKPTTAVPNKYPNLPYESGSNETFDLYLSMFLRDNPNAVVIMSAGYPKPYKASYEYTSPP